MRDKELFQTPVLPSRHRRSLNRREAALSNGREDVRMILLYFLENFFLQVNEGIIRVTAIQQVPPDGMRGGGCQEEVKSIKMHQRHRCGRHKWKQLISPSESSSQHNPTVAFTTATQKGQCRVKCIPQSPPTLLPAPLPVTCRGRHKREHAYLVYFFQFLPLLLLQQAERLPSCATEEEKNKQR